jgi:hypothetical protein
MFINVLSPPFLMNFHSNPPPSSRISISSTTTEGKKRPKTRDFFYKHGHKMHSYDGKAPYPLHYDRSVFEL